MPLLVIGSAALAIGLYALIEHLALYAGRLPLWILLVSIGLIMLGGGSVSALLDDDAEGAPNPPLVVDPGYVVVPRDAWQALNQSRIESGIRQASHSEAAGTAPALGEPAGEGQGMPISPRAPRSPDAPPGRPGAPMTSRPEPLRRTPEPRLERAPARPSDPADEIDELLRGLSTAPPAGEPPSSPRETLPSEATEPMVVEGARSLNGRWETFGGPGPAGRVARVGAPHAEGGSSSLP